MTATRLGVTVPGAAITSTLGTCRIVRAKPLSPRSNRDVGGEMITEENARRQLYAYMTALQKYRSVTAEEIGMSPDLMEEVWPWVFGDKCQLPTLSKILDGPLVPMDYYNQLVILCRFTPEIRAATNINLIGTDIPLIPEEAPTDVLGGWGRK